MLRRVLVLVVVVVLVAGCSRDTSRDAAPAEGSGSNPATSAPAVAGGGEVVHGSLSTPDGRTRTYRLFLPAQPAPDAPLVLALHGGTGNGDQYARSSGYDEVAGADGAVVAYPDGTPTAFGDRRLVWNAGGCCAAAVREGVDDVGFLVALIDELAAEHDLDPTRVLVTGHSNGAMMAMRLGCEAADHVAAVAVQAGTVFVDDCRPSEPVSVMDLHGTEDANLPLEGGVGEESLVGADFPPVRDGLAAFAAAADCEGTGDDGSWGPCPDGVAVELLAVEGADHAWMDDASERLWAFLAQHR